MSVTSQQKVLNGAYACVYLCVKKKNAMAKIELLDLVV